MAVSVLVVHRCGYEANWELPCSESQERPIPRKRSRSLIRNNSFY